MDGDSVKGKTALLSFPSGGSAKASRSRKTAARQGNASSLLTRSVGASSVSSSVSRATNRAGLYRSRAFDQVSELGSANNQQLRLSRKASDMLRRQERTISSAASVGGRDEAISKELSALTLEGREFARTVSIINENLESKGSQEVIALGSEIRPLQNKFGFEFEQPDFDPEAVFSEPARKEARQKVRDERLSVAEQRRSLLGRRRELQRILDDARMQFARGKPVESLEEASSLANSVAAQLQQLSSISDEPAGSSGLDENVVRNLIAQ